MPRFTITLDTPTALKLKELCDDSGASKAGVIRRAINDRHDKRSPFRANPKRKK